MKKIEFKKFIYSGISIIFIIGGAVIFIYVAMFLADSINKSFLVNEKTVMSSLIELNIPDFISVAKRLGISVNFEPEPTPVAPVEQIIEQATTTAPEEVATTTITETEQLDKGILKIAVYNSTKTKGLAAELKSVLESDGFIVEKIGNVSGLEETTIIKIKASRDDYSALVEDSVSKKYPVSQIETLDENDAYDIIIIIGTK